MENNMFLKALYDKHISDDGRHEEFLRSIQGKCKVSGRIRNTHVIDAIMEKLPKILIHDFEIKATIALVMNPAIDDFVNEIKRSGWKELDD